MTSEIQADIITLDSEIEQLRTALKEKEQLSDDNYIEILNAQFIKDRSASLDFDRDQVVVGLEICELTAYDVEVAYNELFDEKTRKEVFKEWLNE